MICVIPIAGRGTRMGPIRKYIPKEMMPVSGIPLIGWAINEAMSAGIRKFVFITAGERSNLSIRYITNEHTGSSIYIKFVDQMDAGGLGAAVLKAKPLIDSQFLLLLPDVICDAVDTSNLIYHHHFDTFIGTTKVKGSDAHQYGIIQHDGRILTGMVEKPKGLDVGIDQIAAVGRYSLQPSIFDHIKIRDKGETGITEAIDSLIKSGAGVYSHPYCEMSIDAGSIEGLRRANNVLGC